MKYVAFLRAINVGGHTVKMDHLRSLFQSMDFAKVETFIASGNVIFESKSKSVTALEKIIEKTLQEALGYEVKTFIRTLDELDGVIRYKSFPRAELERPSNILYIGFMSATPDLPAIKKLRELRDGVNDFHLANREVYWLRRTAAGESEYSGGLIEKTLKVALTLRAVNTVRRIVAKYAG